MTPLIMKNPSDRSSSPTVFRLNFYLDIKNDPDLAYIAEMEQRGHRGFETLRLMRLGLIYDRLIKEQAIAAAKSLSTSQTANPTPASAPRPPVAAPQLAASAPVQPQQQSRAAEPAQAPAQAPAPAPVYRQNPVPSAPKSDNVMPNRGPQQASAPTRQQPRTNPSPQQDQGHAPRATKQPTGASRLQGFLSDGSEES